MSDDKKPTIPPAPTKIYSTTDTPQNAGDLAIDSEGHLYEAVRPDLTETPTIPDPMPAQDSEEYLAWLEEAARVVRTSRRSAYGHPLLNFARIASFYNTYLEGRLNGSFLNPLDVVYMNILTKVAREKQAHKDDNVVDIIGYAATHNAIHNRMIELGYKDGSQAFTTMTRKEFDELLIRLESLEKNK